MKNLNSKAGYSLFELLVVLLILIIPLVFLTPGGDQIKKLIEKNEFNRECENIYYCLLQFQNDAMMDEVRREVKFLSNGVYIVFTKDGVVHRELIRTDEIRYSGTFIGLNTLKLYPSGTVSQGGTIIMSDRNYPDLVRKITVQPANGRIYLNG